MAGFVIIHRDIIEWEWYQSPTVSRLYFHLILKVNYCDKKWQGILVRRGQLITSTKHLAIELNLSIQQIRTALQKLQDSGDIKVHSTNRFTLVTVVNYDEYQTAKTKNNKPTNSQTINAQQSNNNQSTTTKERNKEKKFNKEKIELRRQKFKNQVFEHSQYDFKILNAFYDYWSELNSNKTKMRFEKDDYFDTDIRLKKWVENEKPMTSQNKGKSLLTNR
ncbi:hypothetical protein [Winogradskyella schleiferi]|uniref:hypothetical protein n=1 Tax=Winogradskyella schleiferi TaxID=2686078 RepID=UPI0015BA994E|nr:hypothetical protein [Winogradskyella schleiferi]